MLNYLDYIVPYMLFVYKVFYNSIYLFFLFFVCFIYCLNLIINIIYKNKKKVNKTKFRHKQLV